MENNQIKGDMLNSRQISTDEVLERLITVQTKLALCVEEIPRAVFDPTFDKDIDKVRVAFKDLYDNIRALISPLINEKKENDERIAILENKYGEALAKLQRESKKRETSEKEKESLMIQNTHQGNFCASLGAITGNLLWRSSKYPQIVNSWLTENQIKVGEFLSIANTTFVSFVDTFDDSFPSLKNDECQFVMSVLGTVTNISSTPGGRKFIVDHLSGKRLIAELVKYLPTMFGATGDAMKRLMLKILFNVSMNCEGLQYLFSLKIEEAIVNCFEDSAPVETLETALRLLQSLTYDLADPHILQRLLEKLPINRIQSLAMSDDQKISITAQEIIINLRNSQADVDTVCNDSTQNDPNEL